MFRVGQKVVCVDDESGKYLVPGVRYHRNMHGLKAGEIYTVAELYIKRDNGRECVRLAEIVRPCKAANGIEARGYDAARFRPVQETGMQMLRALLKSKPVKEVA